MAFKDPEQRREYHRRWRAANPEKAREYTARHRASLDPDERKRRARESHRRRKLANPAAMARKKKDWHLRHAYGITLEDYDKMVLQQEGRCAICEQPAHLDVDHCHTSGEIRGLLCRECNTAIGKLRDDASVIRRAADYVESCGTLVVPR